MERNIFAELTEGFEALKAERDGQITLYKVQVVSKPTIQVSAKDDLDSRKSSIDQTRLRARL